MEIHKGMTNLEIASLLRAIASAYQVKDTSSASRFRVIAYNNAADAIEHATSEVKDLWDDDKLSEIPGIGPGIKQSLDEIFSTGVAKHFEEVMDGLPPAMFELLEIPGIGAKKAMRLTKELGITKAHGAVEKLKKAAEKGRIRDMEGFGEQSEKDIIEAIDEFQNRAAKRMLLPYATIVSEEVISWLKLNPNVKRVDTLGSLRRRMATVGDIDLAVPTDKARDVIEHFVRYPKKVKIIEKGDVGATLLLAGSIHVDLLIQPPALYGALLQHFTGSKHHNVALRTYAVKKGMSLSEKGIKINDKLEAFKSEEEFYKRLGMDWIPPEIREDRGEIEEALGRNLPKLVELKDIKGDLHMHTNILSETSHDVGNNNIEEMVEEGNKFGYEYIGITEHNPKSSLSEKEVYEMLLKKKEAVEKVNESLKNNTGIRKVFNGLEIDIQTNGRPALINSAFELLDYAVVSLHSSFKGEKVDQTKRVLTALSFPKVRIFGHPTGRKLNEREGVDLDWDKIFDFCLKNNKWLEINSSPDRLDLPDILVKEAVKMGVKLIVNTDSHDKDWMKGVRYGIDVARRGWCEKKDVVNTLNLTEFEKVLRSG